MSVNEKIFFWDDQHKAMSISMIVFLFDRLERNMSMGDIQLMGNTSIVVCIVRDHRICSIHILWKTVRFVCDVLG